MGIRDDITSLEVSLLYPVEMPKSTANAIREALCRLLAKAADLAETRERELLEQIEAIKSCADSYEFDAECRKVLLDKAKAERAQMIAELRDLSELVHYAGLGDLDESECLTLVRRATIPYMDLTGDHAYHTPKVKAIINKFEALK
jgi:hypothetical protein